MIIKRKNSRAVILGSMGALVVAAIIGIGAALSHGAFASGGMTFTVVGTHPQAAAQTTERGRTITDLMVDGTTLYTGYGDFNGSADPIDINPFNLMTHTFTGSVLSVPSVELMVFRKINGGVYTPMTHPQAPWGQNVGYSTNAGGTWANESKAPMIRVLDLATLNGSDLWMVGSGVDAFGMQLGATARRSIDGGVTWQVVATDEPEFATSAERYSWAASLNGKMYMQAEYVDPLAPVRVFDGTTWTTGTTDRVCGATDPGMVEVFAGHIVCANAATIRLFDGTNVSTVDVSSELGLVYDFYVADDGYLYAVGSTGNIARTSDGQTWAHVTSVPNGNVRSIAVYNDYIYLGTSDSQILRSDAVISQTPPLTPEVTGITPSLVGLNKTAYVWIRGNDFSPGVTVTVGGVPAQVVWSYSEGIQIVAPQRSEPGPVDVVVTNNNRQSVVVTNGLRYGMPTITQVQFGEDGNGRKTLTVTGQGFTLGAGMDGLYASLVSLNGQALPFCTEGTNQTSAELAGYGYDPQYFSDGAPCYYLFSSDGFNFTQLMQENQVTIRLPDDFDTTAPGTVQVHSTTLGDSNVYQFNAPAPTNEAGGNPPAVGVPNTGLGGLAAILPSASKQIPYDMFGPVLLGVGVLGTGVAVTRRQKQGK